MKRVLLAALLATVATSVSGGWYGNSFPLPDQGAAGLETSVLPSLTDRNQRWISNLGTRIQSFESVAIVDTEAYKHVPHAILWNNVLNVTADILGFRAARSLLHVERGTIYARAFGPGIIDSATVTLSAAADSSQDSYWFISFPVDSLWIRALAGDAQCRIESYWP